MNVKNLTSYELSHEALGSICKRGKKKTCGLHLIRDSSWPPKTLAVPAEIRKSMWLVRRPFGLETEIVSKCPYSFLRSLT